MKLEEIINEGIRYNPGDMVTIVSAPKEAYIGMQVEVVRVGAAGDVVVVTPSGQKLGLKINEIQPYQRQA
jgi:hypothetical protein